MARSGAGFAFGFTPRSVGGRRRVLGAPGRLRAALTQRNPAAAPAQTIAVCEPAPQVNP
jgi:hypothetical protein